jgi:hypothetical protein
MKKQKGISLLGVVIVLLVVVAACFGGWKLYNNLTDKNSDSTNGSTKQGSKSPAITWTDYQNAKYGVAFTYPKNWGDMVQIYEKAADVGKEYSVTFIQTGANSGDKTISFAISMGSNDLKASFCKTPGNCVTSVGTTKSSIQEQLKTGSGIAQKDDSSYVTILNDPQQKISGVSMYQIVNLSKINVSAAVLYYQKINSGVNCPADKIATSSTQGCFNQSDYETLNKIAKSIHSI